LTITIEGSNQQHSGLFYNANWTLVYNGSTGLDVNPGRSKWGPSINLPVTNVSYRSYRILATSKRNISNSVQFDDIIFYGN